MPPRTARADDTDEAAQPTPSTAALVREQWSNLGTSTRTTPDLKLVRSGRYRANGDRLVLEIQYEADASVEAFPFHLELEGFEVFEGTDAWSVSLKPETPHTERIVLRATETGIARVSLVTGFRDLETEHDEVSSTTHLAFKFDGHTLEACARGGCPRVATLEDADLSGETILAQMRNDCSEPIELVLFAGPKNHDPPPEAPRHSLSPGEELAVRVDTSTLVYKMDGHRSALVAGLSRTDLVVFAGETCNMVSTRPAQR